IVIHHCGHDGNRPRGHSALLGAVDAQIAVTRDTSDNIIATVERMKDGPEGATVASRLEQVEVGTDEDGDAITSCIVVPVDEGEIVKATPTRKLSDRQRMALDRLGNLSVDGKPLPPEWNMPAGIMAVPIFTWRAEMEKSGVLDTQAANPRADFKRLKDSLQARHLIGEREGLVWKA
ncbi:MAG: AAA family ATPase, partial [bacterium]